MKTVKDKQKFYSRYANVLRFAIGLTVIVLIAQLFFCCEQFVEVDLPNSQLTSTSVFEDKATATATMTDVYASMRDGGLFTGYQGGLSHLLGNYTDELDFYGNPQSGAAAFHNNVVLPSNGDIQLLWDSSYNQIYGANAVLEGVQNSENLATADREQLRGEALFTRALLHFYLTNLYGAIPYVTTTAYQFNSTIAKEVPTQIYGKCIADLNLALSFLPADYVTQDRTRPNKFAARALLARVYLYTQQWSEASNEASAVLNQTDLYTIETDLSKTFGKESQATLWQFSSAYYGANTLEAGTFVFEVGPPPLSALTNTLLQSFENNDQRKIAWIGEVSEGTSTWYYPAKYKNVGTTSTTEYSVMLRLSEIYLIRAEARAHTGDLIGSKEDLNTVRNTAGLLNTNATNSDQLLHAILIERQHELLTELGHRFFDLKRFQVLDDVLSPVKTGWNSFEALLPLPEKELKLNKNLNPQNSGY